MKNLHVGKVSGSEAADQEWISGTPGRATTPSTTPSITVLRASLRDRVYLRYGIHGGVDFQRENQYGPASGRLKRLEAAAEQSAPPQTSSWRFRVDGQEYLALRLRIHNPVLIRPQWIRWQRVVTRALVQPKIYRTAFPTSTLVVRNATGGPLTVQLNGPINKTETLSSTPSSSIYVVPGSYSISVSSSCGPKTDSMTVREGETHEVRYFCSSPPPVAVPPPPAVGYFVVNNTTDAALTVQVGGATYTVASGSSTIQLPVGNYTAIISTRCGTAREALTITAGATHEGKYWCKPVPAPVPVPVPAPAPLARGDLVVNNDTGAALTLRVGGATHTVASGSSTIQLPVGSYTAVVSTRCGTAKETLTITAGSTHEVKYWCGLQKPR